MSEEKRLNHHQEYCDLTVEETQFLDTHSQLYVDYLKLHTAEI